MTRLLLVVIPVAAVAAALVGTVVAWPFAVVTALVFGVSAAAVVGTAHERRLADVARQVNRWLGDEAYRPVRAPHGAAWRQLAVAVNALGAAFERRGLRLRTERDVRETVVDALPEPAALFDPEGYLRRMNEPARERFAIAVAGGLTAAQTFGSADLAAAVHEAREAGRSVEVDVLVDGDEVAAFAVPLGEDILVVLRDVSEQRRVDALRRDFVANASHELKTPVAGLQALADALDRTLGRDPSAAEPLAAQLRTEAERLGRLVHDLLDLRRIEEGRADEPAPVDLADLLRTETERVQPLAEDRGVRLDVTVPERAVVVGIAADLRLVVANLLDNALGYTDRGGTVVASLERDGRGWWFEVRDTGVGIARQDLDRVFERFYRVDVARSRASGGTGLGLSIVRNAVERHGGTVQVESVLGEGSTFRVLLPVEGPPATRR